MGGAGCAPTWRGRGFADGTASLLAAPPARGDNDADEAPPPPLRQRGILVNAGGRGVLTGLVVLLKVLREVHNCTLAVQVAWHEAREMDDATLAALDRRFGPVLGLDLTKVAYPEHHRRVRPERWVAKTYSLLHCAFREVLLLDADSLPLAPPQALFEGRAYREAGALFWPDVWRGWHGPRAAPLLRRLGLAPGDLPAATLMRDAESGQLVVDRARHADALEAVFFLNTWSDRLYHTHLHGDKDTFSLGWALAGKARSFRQVTTPPAGVFHWAEDVLEAKATGQKLPGWQLLGVLQHAPCDGSGGGGGGGGCAPPPPAFLHRTMNKWALGQEPWPAMAVSAPIPIRWATYYLAHDTQGPTKGVWWEHAVPEHALQLHQLNPEPLLALPTAAAAPRPRPGQQPAASSTASSSSAAGGWVHVRAGVVAAIDGDRLGGSGTGWQTCPLVRFAEYLQLRQLGLPLDFDPQLDAGCGGGGAFPQASAAAAQPLALTRMHTEGVLSADNDDDASAAAGGEEGSLPPPPPDGTPLAAMRVTAAAEAASGALRAIRAGEAALHWLEAHVSEFPVIDRGP